MSIVDTSPEYIKMCQMARELQENWTPSDGDYVLYNNEVQTIVAADIDTFFDAFPSEAERVIWLPRIDQLLDILGKDYPPHEGFTMTIKDRSKVEQELLADHYKKNYCKIWNGEDWI